MVGTQMPSRDQKMKSEQDLNYGNEITPRERKEFLHLQILGPQKTMVLSCFSRSAHLAYCWESNNKVIHGNIDSILPHPFVLKPFQHLLFLV